MTGIWLSEPSFWSCCTAAGRTDGLLHSFSNRFERDVERVEGPGRDPLALMEQTEQDVLGADEIVVELACLLLREDEHTSRPVGEPLEQRWHLRLEGTQPLELKHRRRVEVPLWPEPTGRLDGGIGI